MARKLQFSDRPTWQKVKDLSEAAMCLRIAVEGALEVRDAWGNPDMRDLLVRRLEAAVADLNQATGATDSRD